MFHNSVSRKLFGFTMAVALILAGSVGGYGEKKGNPNPGVLPPQSHAFGKTLGEWDAASYSTMFGTPLSKLMLDKGWQMGRIWALPNMPGVNTKTLPPGLAIYVPIGTWATVPPFDDAAAIARDWMKLTQPEIDALTPEELSRITAVWMGKNTITEVSCTIDGRPVENPYQYWYESPTFYCLIDPSWGVCPSSEACISGPAASAGYGLILAPLSVGVHEISFHYCAVIYGFCWDVTWLLTVGK